MSEVILESEKIGRLVHERRIKMKITQERLSREANVSRRTVILLEEGKAPNIGAGKLIGILGVLGMSLIIDEVENAPLG